jgi:hypothetical protein
VDHDIKKQHRFVNAEDFLQKNQMSRAAYGKKFRKPLDRSQNNRLKYVHRFTIIAMAFSRKPGFTPWSGAGPAGPKTPFVQNLNNFYGENIVFFF